MVGFKNCGLPIQTVRKEKKEDREDKNPVEGGKRPKKWTWETKAGETSSSASITAAGWSLGWQGPLLSYAPL